MGSNGCDIKFIYVILDTYRFNQYLPPI
jgi:hypothetical protein